MGAAEEYVDGQFEDEQPYEPEPQGTPGAVGQPPQSRAIVREGFQGVEVRAQAETAAIAMAEYAKASIEARCILAERHPRSWVDVEQRLLSECDRPGFAEQARYRKPQGRKQNAEGQWEQNYIEGFSIRFAEAAIRYMKNVNAESSVIYDDTSQRLVRITVMDLETNATVTAEISVPKTVERSRLKKGQRPISSRVNSYGQQVFLVEATDDEVMVKQAALVSKALRTGVLRLLPGDIQDSCEDRIAVTLAKKDKEDPGAATRKVLDAYAKLGVMPSAIAEYIGHEPTVLQPAELAELRGVYQAIKDGDLTWVRAVEAKTGKESGDEKAEKNAAQVASVIDKARKKADEKKAAPKNAKDAAAPAPAAEPAKTEAPAERQPGEDG